MANQLSMFGQSPDQNTFQSELWGTLDFFPTNSDKWTDNCRHCLLWTREHGQTDECLRAPCNPDFIPADPKHSDPDFLHRIATNYLRHECTAYEDELYKLFGKTGVHEAHDILQHRINRQIVETYPELKNKQ